LVGPAGRGTLGQRNVGYRSSPGTKTGAERTVRLVTPLAQDLAEWRLAEGRPGPEASCSLANRRTAPVTEGQWNRWTQSTLRAAELAVGLAEGARIREAAQSRSCAEHP
jgi:hypothetical protein